MSSIDQLLTDSKTYIEENFDKNDWIFLEKELKSSGQNALVDKNHKVTLEQSLVGQTQNLPAQAPSKEQKTINKQNKKKENWKLQQVSSKNHCLEPMKKLVESLKPNFKTLDIPEEKKPIPFLISKQKNDPFIRELKVALTVELGPIIFCENSEEIFAFSDSPLFIVDETLKSSEISEKLGPRLVVIQDSHQYQENPKLKAILWNQICHATNL